MKTPRRTVSERRGAERGARERNDAARSAPPRRTRVTTPPEDDGAARFAALASHARDDLASIADPRALARASGLSAADLTALFLTHAHVVPSAWLLRERVRSAERRLLSGNAPVGEIAAAAGFASEAAFRRAFAAAARMTPEAYRALRAAAAFELDLPARYRADDVLAYHGRDPASPSERVSGATLAKAVTTSDGPAVLEIELNARWALVRLHAGGPSPDAMRDAHRIALRLLGLTADVRGFEAFAGRDAILAPLVAKRRGLHLPLTATTFEGLAWAIIGQQINLAFAFGLRRDVLELAGEPVGDLIAHPSPARLAGLDVETLRRRRFSRSKAEYLLDTAAAVAAGSLDPETLEDGSAAAAERRLTQLRGIGTWTARYVLMRGVGFADAAPVGDVALAAALEHALGVARRPTTDEVDQLMRRFAPYRSLATFHLWASLKDREKGR